MRLFQTARRFNMEIQPQLVLLEKTLLNIEGLGRQLYPELDLWTTAKPFMERWMKERIGPRALLRRTRANFGPFAEHLPDLPMLAYRVLENMESAQQEARALREEQVRLQREWRERRTLVGALSGAVLIICATLLVLLGPGALMEPLIAQMLAAATFLIGVALLIQQWRAAG